MLQQWRWKGLVVSSVVSYLAATHAEPLHGFSNENSCCKELHSSFKEKVTLRSDSKAFASIKQSYWSFNAQDVTPGCFIQPKSTEEVSKIVSFLTTAENRDNPDCKFAVKSGGHTFWGGASNIEDGVTIDLAGLNDVKVSKDRTIASIGPGGRWGDVFASLDEQGLTVSGGRMGPVGVGGLLTGGGLSYFQGAFGGFACDGIVNHEVVLANGSIVNANRQERADLHRALKGGGNNFGIVTRFDLAARSNTKLWGGTAVAINQRQKAFAWMSKSADSKIGNNSAMPAILQMGRSISMAILADADTSREPQIFKEIQKLSPSVPSIRALVRNIIFGSNDLSSDSGRSRLRANAMGDSPWPSFAFDLIMPKSVQNGVSYLLGGSWALPQGPGLPKLMPSQPEGYDIAAGKLWGLTSHANMASMVGLSAAQGFRLKFFSWTVNNSNPNIVQYLESLDNLRLQEAQKLPFLAVTGALYQPITAKMRATGVAQGGENAMGLQDLLGNDDLILVAIAVPYLRSSHDAIIEDWAQAFSVKGKNMAKELGVYCSFSFLNYSDKWQNSISTYSTEARQFLRQVSELYDPHQVWQKQVPGGFKLA